MSKACVQDNFDGIGSSMPTSDDQYGIGFWIVPSPEPLDPNDDIWIDLDVLPDAIVQEGGV